jgi:hypothetical protein
MPKYRALAISLVVALVSLSPVETARAAECPNCALDFPSSWQAKEQPWGTRVEVDGQQIDVKVQRDELIAPLGPGDVDDELVWLTAELESEARTITSKNGRIVRTASGEPAVVLDFAWSDEAGGAGKGLRLVRRCGVRLIIEQRADVIRLDALLGVSDRVRYTRTECASRNADVIPLEVLEDLDKVKVPDVGEVMPRVTSPSEPAAEAPQHAPAIAPEAAVEEVVEEKGGSALTTFLLAFGVLLLAALVVLMIRSNREDPLENLPAFERAGRKPPRGATSASASPPAERPLPVETGPSHLPATAEPDDPESTTSDEFGDESTDAILPAGTYGLRGAGGGEPGEPSVTPDEEFDTRPAEPASEPELELHALPASNPPRSAPPRSTTPRSVPDDAPISVPSHAVVSYPSISGVSARGTELEEEHSYDHDDYVRVSPVESVIASLGITTWLDFTAPGISGVSYLPSSIAGLLEVQNGGRFGYGWLLLLGLRRKNMDLMTINGESRVKARFGEGWLVGVFAFGNVLWVNPDQSWEIRTLEGERHPLGEGAEQALRRLAEDPSLRELGASHDLVERCRGAVGELLPGWVYRYHGEISVVPEDVRSESSYEPVEIVPFLELLG